MITAVDTSVLLDVLGADPSFGRGSQRALAKARSEGALMIGEVALAEMSSVYDSPDAASRVLRTLEIDFIASTVGVASDAGVAWRAYHQAGGPRARIVADFLIGADAAHLADRLLTRDRGFFRTAFASLTILDPTTLLP